jgi:hypothetical protein
MGNLAQCVGNLAHIALVRFEHIVCQAVTRYAPMRMSKIELDNLAWNMLSIECNNEGRE